MRGKAFGTKGVGVLVEVFSHMLGLFDRLAVHKDSYHIVRFIADIEVR